MVVLLIIGGIPFAGTFAPIIFEWFFLGIPFDSYIRICMDSNSRFLSYLSY
jgi:hypothetical protein